MGSYTPNYNIYKPRVGETGWGTKVNEGFDVIDAALGVSASGSSPIFGKVSIDNTDGTTHLNLTGDPYNVSPNDGDLWWTGTNLNFFNGSDNINLLGGIGYNVASPSGANTQIQFNDNGVFAGHPGLTTDKLGSVSCQGLSCTSLSVAGSVSLTAGTIDGMVIGGSSPQAITGTTITGTTITDGTVSINSGSVTGTWANLGSVTTVDVNGGTIDGTVIGGVTPAAGSFTTVDIVAPALTPHFSLTGDPEVASPSDGDLWWTGQYLNFRAGSETIDILNQAPPSGSVLRTLYTQRQDEVTCSTSVPANNNTRLITEGDEVLSLSIDPVSATNLLKIEVDINVGGNTL